VVTERVWKNKWKKKLPPIPPQKLNEEKCPPVAMLTTAFLERRADVALHR